MSSKQTLIGMAAGALLTAAGFLVAVHMADNAAELERAEACKAVVDEFLAYRLWLTDNYRDMTPEQTADFLKTQRRVEELCGRPAHELADEREREAKGR